ncbi:MFS transporter [Actinokineospora terrae]|uniref:Predicted arabinose efflux permease, MFS family n=1 Tax=Actinokineospora terrae TaxID=155974 RepID=A0A1H9TA37_9PSEU|nr:MFS transporter [Actinokineospora terrae]SER94160.1 Predicted arabinose efflux permease, MFS family [Actinokineospora terrae]
MSALANRTYRRLLVAHVVALVGTGLTTVALGLLAYDLAGAGAGVVLGGVLAVKMVANVLVAPVAAAVAERVGRRALLVSTDLVRCGAALALPWVDAVWQVVALVAVLQVAAATFTPAFQAVIPRVLTDERDYTRALSLSRLAYDVEGVVSPVLAAALLTAITFSWLFVGTAAGFLVSAVLIATLTLPARADTSTSLAERTIKGIRAYRHTPRLRAQLGLNLAAAAGGAMVLVNTVVLVRGDLGMGPTAVAVALGVFAAGSMGAALALPRLLDRRPQRRVMVGAGGVLVALMVAGTAVFWTGVRWGPLLGLWLALGVAYSAVLTPVGRLIRASAHPDDLPALFAAQYALSHAEWLVTYLLAGLLGGVVGPAATLGVLALVAGAGLVFGARAWRGADSVEHVHADLPAGDPHLGDAVRCSGGWRHTHHYVIDRVHRRWPVARR